MRYSHVRFTSWKLEELSRQELSLSDAPLSLMELLDDGCFRLFVIEVCVGKLVLMLLAKLRYQKQAFPPGVHQREKRKHVKSVWGSHVVIYLNVSTTFAFRNMFPSWHPLPMNCSHLWWFLFPLHSQKHFTLLLLWKTTGLFLRRTRNGKWD